MLKLTQLELISLLVHFSCELGIIIFNFFIFFFYFFIHKNMTEVCRNLYVKNIKNISTTTTTTTLPLHLLLLLLIIILEQVNKRHSNIFTKRTEYELQGKQIDN